MCAAFVFACYMYAFMGVLSMVYAFMTLLLQCTTWEPGVEGYYLVMGPKRMLGQFLGTCPFVASHCCDSDQG